MFWYSILSCLALQQSFLYTTKTAGAFAATWRPSFSINNRRRSSSSTSTAPAAAKATTNAASTNLGQDSVFASLRRQRGGGGENNTEKNRPETVLPEPCINLPADQDDNQDKPSCPKYGLLFMDQFCDYHGGYLASKARRVYGVATIHALSTYVCGYLSLSARDQGNDPNDDQEEEEEEEEETTSSHLKLKIPSPDEFEQWMEQIPFEVLAVICESDSGLDEAELIAEAMNVRFQNGYNVARRDKFQMNHVLSKAGLRTVKQKMCRTLEEAMDFARELGVRDIEDGDDDDDEKDNDDGGHNTVDQVITENHWNGGLLGLASNTPKHVPKGGKYCVIKPKRGVASDDVFFCANINHVKEAFQKIQGTSVFGSISSEKNDLVLVQEFASGTEYAIDIVSKNGQHKVAALWRYDKRQANGAPFVYFATELVDSQTPEGELVCDYATKALDALGVKHGMTHSEFILDEEDKGVVRLVEVNCRQHNTNFAPLAMAAIGYNALDMLLDAYLGDLPNLPPETEHLRLAWNEIPERPFTTACGAVVHLVCFQEGELVEIREEILNEIESLPSVYAMEIYDHFQIGNHIDKTVNIRSDCGWVHLINDDQDQFKRDYDRIVELMPLMFVVKDS